MSDKFKRSNIFIALGAATGLGNAFRFPALCVSYGCSFLIAYAVCLALICYPLLCAELALGKRGVNGGKPWACILAAACGNSALIALYYGGISSKLGAACLDFAIFSSAQSQNSPKLLVFGAIIALVAAYMLLNRGGKHLLRMNKLSVISSFALFLFLAAYAFIFRFPQIAGVFSSFDFSSLLSVTVWGEALGQALLSLSLAAGAMPAFARKLEGNFSVRKTAFVIIAANFSGCVLAMLATLPYVTEFPAADTLTCALTVYPQVVSCVAGGGIGGRVFGALVYLILFIVAVNSQCSLASAMGSLYRGKPRNYAIVFTVAAAFLLPAFLGSEGQVMGACDRMACSVNAILIALAECVFFALRKRLKSAVGIYSCVLLKSLCPAACALLTIFSLCGARFSCFVPFARAAGYLSFAAVLLCAVVRFAAYSARFPRRNGLSCKLRKFLQ